jgi:hypothetical protein
MIFADKNQQVAFYEQLKSVLDSYVNKKLRFSENISSVYMNYDRHFTTSNRFTFQLESTSFRFSGARFGLVGTNGELYEIDVMRTYSGDIDEKAITIIESLSKDITRESMIALNEPGLVISSCMS